jgi:hypothetical protein
LKRAFPNSLYMDINLKPKPVKDTPRKENHWPIFLMNMDAKISDNLIEN